MKIFKVVVLSCVWLLACETIVEVDVPRQPTQLVIHSLMLPDTSNYVSVKVSQSVLDRNRDNEESLVSDAQLSLSRNGESYPLQYNPDRRVYELIGLKLQAGQTYQFQASRTGLPTATSSFTIPQVPDFELLEVRESGGKSDKTTYRLRINDRGEQAQFYIVRRATRVLAEDRPGSEPYYHYRLSGLNSNYPGTSNIWLGEGDVLIHNRNFDQSNELEVYEEVYSSGAPSEEEKFLVVYQISEAYYHYLITANANQEGQDNPLAEPVQVKSNIQNGFGVVGGASLNMLRLPEPSGD